MIRIQNVSNVKLKATPLIFTWFWLLSFLKRVSVKKITILICVNMNALFQKSAISEMTIAVLDKHFSYVIKKRF